MGFSASVSASSNTASEGVVVHDSLEESELNGFVGVDVVARHQQVRAGALTDDPGESLRVAPGRNHPQTDLEKADCSGLTSDRYAEGESEFSMAAERASVDTGVGTDAEIGGSLMFNEG
ncbi:hypothetical protein [Natrinema sp. DC36]|uniref:hypothetical protein n=1 Tax=Natrinema sp. DC36 TaxID=2878680 RepID=UPI002106D091|nr:hypothetical protein [Natrinema sp. DC36]